MGTGMVREGALSLRLLRWEQAPLPSLKGGSISYHILTIMPSGYLPNLIYTRYLIAFALG